VFITGNVGDKLMLLAFDLDGKPKWSAPVDKALIRDKNNGARSTPVIDSGNVYLISDAGVIACLDAKSGNKVWSRTMKELGSKLPNYAYCESVLIDGNLAIVTPGGDNCITALDKKTGTTVWSSTGYTAKAHYSSALSFTDNKTPMIVQGTGSGLVCVDPKSGHVLWTNEFSANNTANCPTPAYADGYIFWANGYGKGGICLKLAAGATPTVAWKTSDMVCHHGGYIIDNGFIYGNNNKGWACLDLKTGAKKWSDKGVGKGSLCYADGMLYLFSEDDGTCALAACSPEGLKITGKFSVKGEGESWAHPVVTGGRLYLRYDTNLYCFDVKAK
jgi:outer membrane protein assembly factor BamB